MSKKLVFVTIPMLPPENLKTISYRKEESGELFAIPASFPSIPLIEWNVSGKDEVQIIAVMTEDAAGRSKTNLEKFKEELHELGKQMGFPLKVSRLIKIPHSETKEKQIELFRKLNNAFENDSDIYIDLTYGTKMTTIGLFSSLVYAERIKRCTIKSIIYGKYAHDGSTCGNIYDMRCLYELNMLLSGLQNTQAEKVDGLLDALLGGI